MAASGSSSSSGYQKLHARYEVQQNPIGEGAYADVFKARHRLTGRDVAVKKFHGPAHVEEGGAEREIRIMRLLRHHPHVIRFYEAVFVAAAPDSGGEGRRKKTKKKQKQQVCIVMELAESGELYNHVLASDRGLEEGEARRVFRQLVSGVAYCHRNMVVHHDLKLENVLLDAGKNVKLADFGYSNFFGPVQVPGADCGSLLYAAPEVVAEREEGAPARYLGPEVDMWSCGVILFAMLCGYLPFDGPDDDEQAIKRRIASGRVRIPGRISDDPRALISGMLQVSPHRRMTVGEVCHHPWLQHSIPRYLAMPPPLHDANTQTLKVCDDTVEDVAKIMVGLDKNNLVELLRTGAENQATVAYHLMLDKRYDAPARYMWLVHD
uniref:Uncharacterized protein n=1 Tax=Avena sativa TaxID=4498 RepID=A0ACD6A8H6_AVESA